ncbi:hypothetical protein GCM10011611_19900 [Aliidongia dinghuensis]|uniref:Uncharacterized protein n=1 Tax=Aliidongia dinghuensis TaxID=1867774 RepID=A0A8J2YS54_9PROT|nr:hypothetical protein [Aliidongia dinghuensis]GGF14165.1 hypothetical protein GCM10011611_19900 [Aliidongia dinghuensis]
MSDPTPQERADYLVRRLEQFIRDGRTVRGVSFRDWQAMARAEFENAFTEVEQRKREIRQDVKLRRLLLVASSTLVTIGFWGGVMALDHDRGWIAALIMLASGTILLGVASDFSIRRLWGRRVVEQRRARFERIESFDRQLRQLETEIHLKLKRAEAKARAG